MAIKERGNKLLRLLDRLVGIPLILLLSLFTTKRRNLPRIAEVRSLAFFKSAAIGDTVILSGVVADIRRINPNARLTIFTASSNYDAARLIPRVDEVVKLPITRPLEAIRQLRDADEFDVWIDFGPWPRLNALLSWASRAKFTVGFKTVGQYRHYLYDLAIPHRNDVHELQNYRSLLIPFDVVGTCMPSLKAACPMQEEPLVVIHMFPGGSNSYLKEWPEDRWVGLISRLCENGKKVILTGGPADWQKADAVVNKVKSTMLTNVAGKLSLERTVNLLNSAKLVISVNTGIMHVASALGCNLVSLNGPTSVVRWGSLNKNSISLTPKRGCSPCINLGFEYKCDNNACMLDITPDDVLKAADELTPCVRMNNIETV